MGQFGPKHVVSTRQRATLEKEWPIRLPAATAISGNVITVGQLAGAGALYTMGIDENALKGQKLFVLEKAAGGNPVAGRTVMVTENTSNAGAVDDTITVDEIFEGANIYGDWPVSVLADWARIGVTTYGVPPGAWSHTVVDADYEDAALDKMWGIVDDADLPDVVHAGEGKYAHGSTRMPNYHQFIFNTDEHPVNMTQSAISARHWSNMFGKVIDKASKFDAGIQDITLDVLPGDNQVQIAAAGVIVATDYVQIGDNTNLDNTEIRQVTDNTAGLLTLDRPLCFFHDASDANETVKEVHAECYDAFVTSEGITHVMSAVNGIAPSICIGVEKKGEHDGVTVEDWYTVYPGARFNELSIDSNTSKELVGSFRGIGHNGILDPVDLSGTKLTVPSLDDTDFWLSGVPKDPVHYSRSAILIDTIAFPTLENLSMSIRRILEGKRGHAFSSALFGIQFGRKPMPYGTKMEYDCSFMVPLHKKRLYELLQDRSSVDLAATYSIVRSSTFTETWLFTVNDMPVLEAGLRLPSEAVESQEVLGPPQSITLTVFDKIPYY